MHLFRKIGKCFHGDPYMRSSHHSFRRPVRHLPEEAGEDDDL